jgi:hypothetical protein
VHDNLRNLRLDVLDRRTSRSVDRMTMEALTDDDGDARRASESFFENRPQTAEAWRRRRGQHPSRPSTVGVATAAIVGLLAGSRWTDPRGVYTLACEPAADDALL